MIQTKTPFMRGGGYTEIFFKKSGKEVEKWKKVKKRRNDKERCITFFKPLKSNKSNKLNLAP